jgi:transcriptional regulator of heat shock response
LDEDEVIKNIISDEEIENGLVIKIGKENRIEDFKDMSLVISGYKSLGEMGKIGIIGPVRMEYWKAAGTVETGDQKPCPGPRSLLSLLPAGFLAASWLSFQSP